MQVDDYGLEILGAAECRALLATRSVGRIGTSIEALPVIVPVDYGIDGNFVVFRTKPDTRFDKSLIGHVVCFEVDVLDEAGEWHWGVNVTGEAESVYPDADVARLDALGVRVPPWETHWVRLPTTLITGRRLIP